KCPSDLESTVCRRRCIGTCEINDGRPYLNEPRCCFHVADQSPLFDDWLTTVPRAIEKKLLGALHTGCASVFKAEFHIEVESGIVSGKRRIDNAKKKY
ncbi:MAG: hypothetical protein M0Z81_04015, partial [Deltaproteobacteria bacterium]|nr:hypothetical protein [Deltaproteobacteria bacterium]